MSSILSDFAGSTSLHGLSHVTGQSDTVGRYNKWGWKNKVYTVVMVMCLVMASYNMYFIMLDYLDYPVTTEVGILNNINLCSI